MGKLVGGDALQLRLKSLHLAFRPIGKAWADEAVVIGRPLLPVRRASMPADHAPGRLHDSLRRKSATQTKAVVSGHYTGYFVDAGVRPHTVFGKRHPGYKARPFRARMAHEALRRKSPLAQIIKQWNDAA